MARTVGIGHQDFETLIRNHLFYIDKTHFIREWWENADSVTLIARPRRFGKTLNMSMLEQFFSVQYAGRSDLFEGLDIWKEERYRKLQGTYPVITISFASVKETSFVQTRKHICQIITDLYHKFDFLLKGNLLSDSEKAEYLEVCAEMEDFVLASSLKKLSNYLCRAYDRKVLIFLDEYDTPMQEAYVNGYWEEMTGCIRSLFNATFKSNPYMERSVMTGVTRVSRESVFSDLNNLEVVTTTSDKYEDSFGFTEDEVFAALKEFGILDKKDEVKAWYDGFTFGDVKDIYNPWSVINYLDKQKTGAYWANTSSNALVSKLIREGSPDVKTDFEELLKGRSLDKGIDEQIVFRELLDDENAIWSFLLASGYLKVDEHVINEPMGREEYRLSITNKEVRIMFSNMVRRWFSRESSGYNAFIRAMLRHDLKSMNGYMNRVALATISYFDTGKKPSEASEPEKFYHGFVLGLMVELADRYVITSNRESGFGRYDIMLEPLGTDDAIIIEFKVFDSSEENTLADTVKNALLQIEEEKYEAALIARGIPKERIRKYGFAFEGKKVLIGE
ncbi:AAA family ATPase [Roseburia hominis]